MNRDQAIKTLQLIGAEIAKEMGYTEMVIGEDRQKGVWGENFTKFLETEYGECTKEIKWFKENKPNNLSYGDNIEFSFRFSSPQLIIDHRNVDGSLASIELSDFCHSAYIARENELKALSEEERGKKKEIKERYNPLVHTGEFRISEIQVFMGDDGKGLEYLDMLRNAWNEATEQK